jgi:hypothetical protein
MSPHPLLCDALLLVMDHDSLVPLSDHLLQEATANLESPPKLQYTNLSNSSTLSLPTHRVH